MSLFLFLLQAARERAGSCCAGGGRMVPIRTASRRRSWASVATTPRCSTTGGCTARASPTRASSCSSSTHSFRTRAPRSSRTKSIIARKATNVSASVRIGKAPLPNITAARMFYHFYFLHSFVLSITVVYMYF